MNKIHEVEVEVTGLTAKVKKGLIEDLLRCDYSQTIYLRNRRSIDKIMSLDLYTTDEEYVHVGLGAIYFLAKSNPFYRFKFKSIIPPRKSLSKIEIPEILLTNPKWSVNGKERWYLHECLDACRNAGMGYVKLPTGTGKTIIELILAYNQARETGTGIILVPTNPIKSQFIKSATESGINLIEYSVDREVLDGNSIYITTPLILSNDIKRAQNVSAIKWVISDEAHHNKTDTIYNIFQNLPNVIRSHGFSALPIVENISNSTSFRSIDIQDALNISISGPIIYEKTSDELKEFLNIPLLVNYKYVWTKNKYKNQYSREWFDIQECVKIDEDRKVLIANLLRYFVDKKFKTILHVDRREYGEQILEICDREDIVAWYGGGDVFSRGRQTNYTVDDLRRNFGTIQYGIIGTSHLVEGLDFDHPLNVLILASGKSTRQVIQKSGRIVRPDDKKSYIINISDEGIYILPRQSLQRSKDVKSEFNCKKIDVDSMEMLKSIIDSGV